MFHADVAAVLCCVSSVPAALFRCCGAVVLWCCGAVPVIQASVSHGCYKRTFACGVRMSSVRMSTVQISSVCMSSVRVNRGGGGRARGGYGYSYWFPTLRKNA